MAMRSVSSWILIVAPDVEAVMIEMKSCDIAAEEAFEPAVLAEDETAHS